MPNTKKSNQIVLTNNAINNLF